MQQPKKVHSLLSVNVDEVTDRAQGKCVFEKKILKWEDYLSVDVIHTITMTLLHQWEI